MDRRAVVERILILGPPAIVPPADTFDRDAFPPGERLQVRRARHKRFLVARRDPA